MRKLTLAVALAFATPTWATGYHAMPKIIVKEVIVTKTVTVTNTQTVYVKAASSTAWVGYTVGGLVAIYFGAAIAAHEQCIRDEDARKVPDSKRKCYKHKPL